MACLTLGSLAPHAAAISSIALLTGSQKCFGMAQPSVQRLRSCPLLRTHQSTRPLSSALAAGHWVDTCQRCTHCCTRHISLAAASAGSPLELPGAHGAGILQLRAGLLCCRQASHNPGKGQGLLVVSTRGCSISLLRSSPGVRYCPALGGCPGGLQQMCLVVSDHCGKPDG